MVRVSCACPQTEFACGYAGVSHGACNHVTVVCGTAAVVRFIRIFKEKMESNELQNQKLVYWTGETPQLRTKSAPPYNLSLSKPSTLNPKPLRTK